MDYNDDMSKADTSIPFASENSELSSPRSMARTDNPDWYNPSFLVLTVLTIAIVVLLVRSASDYTSL